MVLVIAVAGCATEDEPPPICTTRLVRIDEITIPGNNNAAKVVSFDLDGDRVGDNQLGMVAGVVQDQLDVDLSGAVNARLASEIAWDLEVRDCDDGTQTLVRGDEMPVAAMFDPSARIEPGWITAIRSAVFIEPFEGKWRGRVGMGLPSELVLNAFTVPIAEYLTNHQLFLATFDTMPQDGRITPQELASTTLIKSLLAPDLGDGKLGLSFGLSFTAVEQ